MEGQVGGGMMMGQAPAAPGEPVTLTWKNPGGLWGLSLFNTLLRVLTFNVYTYWAKAEVRRRLWSGVRINGEPLVYHGTGLELFLGFLVALPIIGLPFALVFGAQLYAGASMKAVIGILLFFYYIVLAWLWGIAIFRARRYRLTRTSWRGIRGYMEGSPAAFGWLTLWTVIPLIFSLGWAHPWRQTKLQRALVDATRLGATPLKFDGTSGPLYGPFALLWVGSVVGYFAFVGVIAAVAVGLGAANQRGGKLDQSQMQMAIVAFTFAGLFVYFILVGLLSVWYSARQFNHFSASTKIEGASFKGDATALGVLWLNLSNVLIVLVPAIVMAALGAVVLGITGFHDPRELALNQTALNLWLLGIVFGVTIFLPVVQARSARYWLSHLQLEGTLPLAQIAQNAKIGSRFGEGLAEAFDIDVF